MKPLHTIIYTLSVAILLASSLVIADSDAQQRRNPTTKYKTLSNGDTGYFQANDSQKNLMLLYNDQTENIVSRYRSAAGHKYKMWIDDGRVGAFPINLATEERFRDWLAGFDKPSQPNKHYCEVVENAWSAWSDVGTRSAACGTHTVSQQRTCSTNGAVKPCDGTCPTESETRNITINNGTCGNNSGTGTGTGSGTGTGTGNIYKWVNGGAGDGLVIPRAGLTPSCYNPNNYLAGKACNTKGKIDYCFYSPVPANLTCGSNCSLKRTFTCQ